MKGELIGVWPEVWKEVIKPAIDHDVFGKSCAQELYRELISPPAVFDLNDPVPPPEAYDGDGALVGADWIRAEADYANAKADHAKAVFEHELIVMDPERARQSLRMALRREAGSEAKARRLLEGAYVLIADYGSEPYWNGFFLSVEKFLEKYSLRYDLKRPFSLHPTLPGVFASLIRDLRVQCRSSAHLFMLLQEFEESFRDLRDDPSPNRIKIALSKQFNLAEGLGCTSVGEFGLSLGELSNRLDDWPHGTVKAALGNLYGLRSDYPGIGHGGNPAGVRRDVDMRDLVALAVIISGYSPYLSTALDGPAMFEGRG